MFYQMLCLFVLFKFSTWVIVISFFFEEMKTNQLVVDFFKIFILSFYLVCVYFNVKVKTVRVKTIVCDRLKFLC